MLSILQQFHENMERVRTIGGFYETLGQLTTSAVDATDLLRTQIVMAVSALDHYIHEITRVGMLEVYRGERPQTGAFLHFQVRLDAVLKRTSEVYQDDEWLDREIRRKHGYLAFQQPDRIADAIRLFSTCELWPSVASQLNLNVSDVRAQLQLIVTRRNQIAHEADLDSDQPGSRWPISPSDSTNAVDFIQNVCEAIYLVVT